MSILNIGCGAGRETFAFHSLGFHRVCGVDLTPEFIAIAEERRDAIPADIPFHVAPARQLPFPNGQFDLATMFENVYGHITPRAYRLEALVEARRVLKPGGLLFLEATSIRTMFRYWAAIRIMDAYHRLINPYHLEFGDKLTVDAGQVDVPKSERPRTHWFTPREISEEAESAALEIAQATTQKGIVANPTGNSKRYRGEGRLLYVLRRPIGG